MVYAVILRENGNTVQTRYVDEGEKIIVRDLEIEVSKDFFKFTNNNLNRIFAVNKKGDCEIKKPPFYLKNGNFDEELKIENEDKIKRDKFNGIMIIEMNYISPYEIWIL